MSHVPCDPLTSALWTDLICRRWSPRCPPCSLVSVWWFWPEQRAWTGPVSSSESADGWPGCRGWGSDCSARCLGQRHLGPTHTHTQSTIWPSHLIVFHDLLFKLVCCDLHILLISVLELLQTLSGQFWNIKKNPFVFHFLDTLPLALLSPSGRSVSRPCLGSEMLPAFTILTRSLLFILLYLMSILLTNWQSHRGGVLLEGFDLTVDKVNDSTCNQEL